MECIRVSCAGLCCIVIDGHYLVEINRSRGDILTPMGGALALTDDPAALSACCRFKAEQGRDLRGLLPVADLAKFEKWFGGRRDRELSPERELYEELVDEHGAVNRAELDGVCFRYLHTTCDQRQTTKPGRAGVMTAYFFEYFDVVLPPKAKASVRDAVTRAGSRLFLLSPHDLQQTFYDSGDRMYAIALSCREMVHVGGTDP